MIDLEHSSHDRSTPQVIHSKVRAPLIFIFQKCKSLGFSGFFVTHEVDIHGLAELGEDGDDIPFGELEREPSDVYVRCIAVVGVPGCFCGSGEFQNEGREGCIFCGMGMTDESGLHSVFKFAFVQILNFTNGIHVDGRVGRLNLFPGCIDAYATQSPTATDAVRSDLAFFLSIVIIEVFTNMPR